MHKTSIILAILLFSSPTFASSSLQGDYNKPEVNSIPYNALMMEVLQLITGNTNDLVTPISTSSSSSLNYLAGSVYQAFYANAWILRSPVTTTQSKGGGFFGFLKTTTTTRVRIYGSNSFTGESFDSGSVVKSSSTSGISFLALTNFLTGSFILQTALVSPITGTLSTSRLFTTGVKSSVRQGGSGAAAGTGQSTSGGGGILYIY